MPREIEKRAASPSIGEAVLFSFSLHDQYHVPLSHNFFRKTEWRYL